MNKDLIRYSQFDKSIELEFFRFLCDDWYNKRVSLSGTMLEPIRLSSPVASYSYTPPIRNGYGFIPTNYSEKTIELKLMVYAMGVGLNKFVVGMCVYGVVIPYPTDDYPEWQIVIYQYPIEDDSDLERIYAMVKDRDNE